MSETRSYFVTKVDNFTSLKRCVDTGKWACKDRVSPPHPSEFLTLAIQRGEVFLIFSVINNHGWHGIAKVTSLPGVSDTSDKDISLIRDTKWHYFDVEWIVNFSEFGEQCLSSKLTEDLTCVENGKEKLVNKCRNWQEIDTNTGKRLCDLISEFHTQLKTKQLEKVKQQKDNLPPPFCEITDEVSVQETWQKIVGKVEKELGKVILACPFGSQRY